MRTIIVRLLALLFLALGAGLPALAQPTPAPAAPAPAATPSANPAAGPSKVKVGVYINDIQAIDLRNHSYVADIYIWFRNSDPEITPGASFEFMNMFAPNDHVQKAVYDKPQDQPDGSKYELFRHAGAFSTKFSVRTYPFDSHDLRIEIEDADWTASKLNYVVDEISINPQIELPGFTIGKPRMTIINKPYTTAFGDLANPKVEPYSRAIIEIPIKRPVVSGIIKTLLPVWIVVLVAGAALLLDPSHVEARVGLAITALLTLVALQFNASSGLPDVGYLLMLDQIYLASFGFVLLVVMLLVRTTRADDKGLLRGAHAATEAIARGGWGSAMLVIAIYSILMAIILGINLLNLSPGITG